MGGRSDVNIRPEFFFVYFGGWVAGRMWLLKFAMLGGGAKRSISTLKIYLRLPLAVASFRTLPNLLSDMLSPPCSLSVSSWAAASCSEEALPDA